MHTGVNRFLAFELLVNHPSSGTLPFSLRLAPFLPASDSSATHTGSSGSPFLAHSSTTTHNWTSIVSLFTGTFVYFQSVRPHTLGVVVEGRGVPLLFTLILGSRSGTSCTVSSATTPSSRRRPWCIPPRPSCSRSSSCASGSARRSRCTSTCTP